MEEREKEEISRSDDLSKESGSERKENLNLTEKLRHNPWILSTFVLAILVVILLVTGWGQTPTTTGSVIINETQEEGLTQKALALIGDDEIKGDENAPVTIVEFSDYECPFCRKFYLESLPQIKEKYIDTGKVKLVYKDFPLSFHLYAQKAAEAAECAGEQGMYYEMHDKIYDNAEESLEIVDLKRYAKELELNTESFNECLDTGEMHDEVIQDFWQGQELGVSGTPAFFINELKIEGAHSFSVFESVIEQELERLGAS